MFNEKDLVWFQSFCILGLCIWWSILHSLFAILLPSVHIHEALWPMFSSIFHIISCQHLPSTSFSHVFMASIRFTMLNTELGPSDCFCISKGFQHWIRIQHLRLHTSASWHCVAMTFRSPRWMSNSPTILHVLHVHVCCFEALPNKPHWIPQKGELKWKHIGNIKDFTTGISEVWWFAALAGQVWESFHVTTSSSYAKLGKQTAKWD